MDHETQSITLKIADKRITTRIRREDEAYIKGVEKSLNELWEQFKLTIPGKHKDDYLALVAFQFAKMYYDEFNASREREKELKDFISDYENKMDEIILDIP